MGGINTCKAVMGYTFGPEDGHTCQNCAHSTQSATHQPGGASVHTWCKQGSFLVSPAAGCDKWAKRSA